MFKDQFKEFQHIVRELTHIRESNLKIKEGEPQNNLYLFAEASLVLLALERFLRIMPILKSKPDDTFRKLLQKIHKKNITPLINEDSIILICDIRNAITHGIFEKRAKKLNYSKDQYFKIYFIKDIEFIYQILDKIVNKINPTTGQLV